MPLEPFESCFSFSHKISPNLIYHHRTSLKITDKFFKASVWYFQWYRMTSNTYLVKNVIFFWFCLKWYYFVLFLDFKELENCLNTHSEEFPLREKELFLQYFRNHTKSTAFLTEFGCTVNIVFSENTKYHNYDISNKGGGGRGEGED